jgi:hypothetical protein
MRRYHSLTIRALVGLIAAALLGISCGPSKARRAEIDQDVSTFVAEWQRGDLDKIYDSMCPPFPQSREEFHRWQDVVRGRRGAMRDLQITGVRDLLGTPAIYNVDIAITYDSGRTTGILTFSDRHGPLCLATINLENLAQSGEK